MLQRRSVPATAIPRPLAVVAGALALGGCGLIDTATLGGGEFERRVYVGGGALVSRLEPTVDADDGVELDEKSSAGGSLTLGYDLSERLSMEGHVAALGEATFDPTGDLAYRVGGLSGIVYALGNATDRRSREGFAGFGRLGVGTLRRRADDIEYERDDDDVHLLVGAGLEYGLANGLAVRGELVSHDTDARYAQLGLLYRFGGSRTAAAVPEPAPGVAAVTPPADTDGDGVADAADRCTGTRAGRPVDADGCDILDGVAEGVGFEPGSDTLTAEARDVLSEVAATLREYPALVVAIEAHTDNRGAADNNLELSRRRALAVARHLAGEGVEPGRLRPKAYGESRPLTSNATAEGRAENRRVELSVVE